MFFLFNEKHIPFNLFFLFNLYEIIFRHHHAHGWNLFFYYFLLNSKNIRVDYPYHNNILYDKSIKISLSMIPIKNQDELRKKIKKDSLSHLGGIDIINFIEVYPISLSSGCAEELVLTLTSSYNIESINSLIDFGLTDLEDIKNFYIEQQQNGSLKEFKISLNFIAFKIFAVFESIKKIK